MIRFAAIAGVFVIAVAVRWPSCGESFWLDELHTVWCISGTFDQVGDRAKIGNQQPAYFDALFLWQFCLPAIVNTFYGIEAALRVTSVLLTSVSAAWLVAIVSRRYERLKSQRLSKNPSLIVGGVAAGLALSLDSNAIFFGTELRPYAAIIFLTTAALALGRRLIELAVPEDIVRKAGNVPVPYVIGFGGCTARAALHGLVLIAAAIHITSLIVLAPQLLIFAIGDVWQHRKSLQSRRAAMITHLCAGLGWIALAVWWFDSHAGLWQSRGNWNSFAMVDRWHDVWQMWPWGALVLLPIVGWAISCQLRGRPQRQAMDQRNVFIATLVLTGVIGSTITCYLLTAYAGIPLWHRRYLIASLPLLCAVMGWFTGAIERLVLWERLKSWIAPRSNVLIAERSATIFYTRSLGTSLPSIGVALACLLLLTYQQQTLATWYRGESQLVWRGEDWNSAVAFVRQRSVDGDRVWIDAGLIEQNGLPTSVSDAPTEAYLKYVVAGPYRLGNRAQAIGIGRDAISVWLDPPPADFPDSPRFLITRRQSQRMGKLPAGVAGYRFGKVTVLIRR